MAGDMPLGPWAAAAFGHADRAARQGAAPLHGDDHHMLAVLSPHPLRVITQHKNRVLTQFPHGRTGGEDVRWHVGENDAETGARRGGNPEIAGRTAATG
jgi:hypothetical protein